MKFGKLPNVDLVDFSLPADPAGTQVILRRYAREQGNLQCYIGATGWSMKEWVGTVYPAGAKSKDYLRYYTQQFNTIELNTTHYRIPTMDTVRRWYAESVADFQFCPKIPQTISHSRNLGISEPQLAQFCESIRHLKEKLGCCFLQLPPYFGSDRLSLLETFLAQFPTDVPLAVEVRHESWFARTETVERLFEVLEKHSIAAVITDVAGRRDVLHMRLTSNIGMIRFVGNGLHPTDYQRIADWVQRIQEWAAAGLSRLYFFTHEPDNILAPTLAAHLATALQELPQIDTRGPKITSNHNQHNQFTLF